ncbi:MAG: CoA pyrophosphatase [Myxococcota bacterium]
MAIEHRLRQAVQRPPARLEEEAPRAAVAAIVDARGDLLLMRRAEHPDDPWSGHLSFPGGRVEPSDVDSLAAAIRETSEEIGFDLSPDQLIGPLDDLTTRPVRRHLIIEPFVFFVPEPGPFQLNEEVQSLHRVQLDALLTGVGRTQFPLSWKGETIELPCVDVDGLRLWGLTLRMVDDLLHRIDGRGVGLGRPTPE